MDDGMDKTHLAKTDARCGNILLLHLYVIVYHLYILVVYSNIILWILCLYIACTILCVWLLFIIHQARYFFPSLQFEKKV